MLCYPLITHKNKIKIIVSLIILSIIIYYITVKKIRKINKFVKEIVN